MTVFLLFQGPVCKIFGLYLWIMVEMESVLLPSSEPFTSTDATSPKTNVELTFFTH